MAVKSYNLYTDGDTLLSSNFRVREFACKNGNSTVLIDENLVLLLQKIRNHFCNKYGSWITVNINSAYRTPSHNASVGGASNSQHIYGTAADICIPGVSPLEIVQYATYLLAYVMPVRGGVGLYDWGAHVDTRGYTAYWPNGNGYGCYQGTDDGGTLWGDGKDHIYDKVIFPGYIDLSDPAEERDLTLDVDNEHSAPKIIRHRYAIISENVWQSVGEDDGNGMIVWSDFVNTKQPYSTIENLMQFSGVVDGQYYIKAQTQLEYGDTVIPCVDDEGNNYTAQTEAFAVTEKPGEWFWGNYPSISGTSRELYSGSYVPSKGKELQPIKASQWSLFTKKINKVRILKGLPEILFHPVCGPSNYSTESSEFTQEIYNEVAAAIRELGGNVSDIDSNTVLSASLFTDLKDAFNEIVNTLD